MRMMKTTLTLCLTLPSATTDAGLFGATIGPDEAYRFTKGEVVTASSVVRARLLRPLEYRVLKQSQRHTEGEKP